MFLWRFAVTLNLHDKLNWIYMILASLGWVQTQSAGIRHYLNQIFHNWSCLYWSQSTDDSLYLTKEFYHDLISSWAMQDGWQQHIFSLVVVNLITKWLTNFVSYELTRWWWWWAGSETHHCFSLCIQTECALVKRQIKCFSLQKNMKLALKIFAQSRVCSHLRDLYFFYSWLLQPAGPKSCLWRWWIRDRCCWFKRHVEQKIQPPLRFFHHQQPLTPFRFILTPPPPSSSM